MLITGLLLCYPTISTQQTSACFAESESSSSQLCKCVIGQQSRYLTKLSALERAGEKVWTQNSEKKWLWRHLSKPLHKYFYLHLLVILKHLFFTLNTLFCNHGEGFLQIWNHPLEGLSNQFEALMLVFESNLWTENKSRTNGQFCPWYFRVKKLSGNEKTK